jgi:hypothetical protein
MNYERDIVSLSDKTGAGEHCHMGAFGQVDLVIFDWLTPRIAN